MPGIEQILIVGASTRAAAFSAARAGLSPRCLDLFADADLRGLCPVAPFDPDSQADDLERLAASFGWSSWMYTGSMEGRPDLVERLSALGRLLGNGPEVLRRCRDPWLVSDLLRSADFATPALRRASEGPAETGTWLRKDSGTAGGVGVTWAGPDAERGGDHAYVQEYIEGPTFSALFVAASGRSRLIGTAAQERGGPASPFHYRGSIAPWPVDPATDAELARMGATLAAEFSLVGLFGVDFILSGGRPWAVEVNPRYTASVELYEDAFRRPLLADHVMACREGGAALDRIPGTLPMHRVAGKRVLYADRAFTFPAIEIPHRDDGGACDVPPLADVPPAGTRIERGQPVLTCFATGSTPEACRERLDRREETLTDWFAGMT